MWWHKNTTQLWQTIHYNTGASQWCCIEEARPQLILYNLLINRNGPQLTIFQASSSVKVIHIHRNHTSNFEFWSSLVKTNCDNSLRMLGAASPSPHPQGEFCSVLVTKLTCSVTQCSKYTFYLYFQFLMGLSGCNPIISEGVSIYNIQKGTSNHRCNY
jgi:hypothetical protein